MKTLLLEVDESIYAQVLNFLKLLPEKRCHVIETPPSGNKPLDITSAFGLVKTPLTATLEEIEQGVAARAIDDSD
jgi:hypothetical protein